MFQNITQIVKSKLFFNESRQRKTQPSSEGRRWHYLAVKKLSALLRRITSKLSGDFYVLNCVYSFRTKNILESHKKVYENKDFCNVIKPSKDTKILEFNQYQKSNKAPFIIYADLEFLIKKIDGCKNNPENSFTTKIGEYIPSGFLMSTISSFRSIENDVNRGKDCMKIFCESLREHAVKLIYFKKKKVRSYENAKICYIYQEKFQNKYVKDKKYCEVTNHCHYAG